MTILRGTAPRLRAAAWTAVALALVWPGASPARDASAEDTKERPTPKAALGACRADVLKLAVDSGIMTQADADARRERTVPLKAFESDSDGRRSADAARAAFLEIVDRELPSTDWVEGAAGVVEFANAGRPLQAMLAFRGDSWVVTSPFHELGPKSSAAKANRGKAARTTLLARNADSKGWGERCALSFVHATQDPAEANGRMDVWYCWNGDLHFCADDVATVVEEKSLDGVKRIPASESWGETLPAKAGTVFVVRSLRRSSRDFFVVARVSSADAGQCVLDWRLLAAAHGAPASIHEPQPYRGNDGADGIDGLCGRSAAKTGK